MPMKSVNDLAENEVVHVIRKLCHNHDSMITVVIRLQKPPGSVGGSSVKIVTGRELLEEQAAIEKSGSGRDGFIDVEREHDCDYWHVSKVEANHGWGPFLYDIAMELVTGNGQMLRSGNGPVTRDARAVWDYYFTKRPDVFYSGCPDRKEYEVKSMQNAYRKPAALTIAALHSSGKIKYYSTEMRDE
jgi:hypothetical protein